MLLRNASYLILIGNLATNNADDLESLIMPVILAVLSALAAAGFWYWRVKAANDVAAGLFDAANDVRLAARRFGYQMRNKTHPADSVDDARLAAAGVVAAAAGLSSEFNQDDMDAATVQFQSKFDINKKEAEEIVIFGKWLATQCGTKDEAVRRLSKRVFKLAGMDAGPDLIDMVQTVAKVDMADRDSREADALTVIRRIFSH